MEKYLAVHNQKPLGLCDSLDKAYSLCDKRVEELNQPFEFQGTMTILDPLLPEEWYPSTENDVKCWHRYLVRGSVSGFWHDGQCIYEIE